MNHFKKLIISLLVLNFTACAGMKVIHPEDEKEKGTMAVDWKTGKVVPTVSCKLAGMGKTYRAIGKTNEEATKEVVARCRDGSLISICEEKNVKCWNN